MEVSVQHHSPSDYLPGKKPGAQRIRSCKGRTAGLDICVEEIPFAIAGVRTPDRPERNLDRFRYHGFYVYRGII
jgi:hypothetical protein